MLLFFLKFIGDTNELSVIHLINFVLGVSLKDACLDNHWHAVWVNSHITNN